MAAATVPQPIEKHMRLDEFATRSTLSLSSIRRKIRNGELAYRRLGRLILIPESSLTKLLGDLHEASAPRGKKRATR
jgi:excisionase family DNA binding protein